MQKYLVNFNLEQIMLKKKNVHHFQKIYTYRTNKLNLDKPQGNESSNEKDLSLGKKGSPTFV